MKINSCSKATGLVLTAVAAALILAVEPAASQDQSQSQYRRDRSRRDVPDTPQSQAGRPVPDRQDSASRPDFSRFDRNRRDPRMSADAGRQGPSFQDKNRPGNSPQGRDLGPRGSNSSRDGRISGPAGRESRAYFGGPRVGQENKQYTEQYSVVLSRNMFSRERVPSTQIKPPVRTVVNPESYFLLRGITHEDHPTGSNQFFVAFVEDKQNGSVLRLHEGDHVARGQIKALTLDGFEYHQDKGEKPFAVSLGTDLEGKLGGAVTAGDLANLTPAPTPSAPGSSGSKPTISPADEADIVKRLMEQRQQQLGQ